jgi:ATP-binding cassette, subfamily B, bacterial
MKHLLRILRTASELKRYYVGIGVFTILLSLMNLLQPLLSGFAVDELRKGHNASISYVVWLAVGIFALDLGANIFSNLGGYLGDQMSLKLNRLLSRRYFEHLMELPQQFFDTELTGKLINRLNRSINQLTAFIQTMSNNFLQFLFTTIFVLIVTAYYSWQVALMFFAVYPIYVYFTARSSKKWQAWQSEKNLHFDIASGRFAEVINHVKVVKSFLQERHELRYFSSHYTDAVNINQPQSKYWHNQDFIRRFVLNFIFFLVYLFIFVRGAQGHLSPGQVVALILYGMQIRTPIFTISMLVDATQRSVADSKDYFEIMDIKPTITDMPNAKELRVNKAAISFQEVSFGYDANKPVVQNISLEIASGSKVALVGESGEGKTTLTNLLLRLYEPTSGSIIIDGQDCSQVTQASLRGNIGIVFQDAALFSGTIHENIAYARPDADMETIIAAAKAANAADFINGFEKGYNTEIGERGLKRSGGQRQRIAIARAILKDAPILVLDEATSSLDSRSEYLVQEALQHLMKDRTTIVIAHRLSTIQHVDKIITLKNGRIDETGTPAELASSGGIYAQLLQLQDNHGSQADKKLQLYGFKQT